MSRNFCRKVPQIMQMEFVECGAVCVNMICAYYGKWIPLEKVRNDCGVSRDGSKASNMYDALKNYGFDVNAYMLDPERVRNVNFPCIIHWGHNHFVVLRGFKGNRALINDPSRGQIKVPINEFEEEFTGVVLCALPNKEFEKSGTRPSVIKFVKERIKGSWGMLVFIAIISALVSAFGLISPFLSQVFTDKLIGGYHPELVGPFFILLLTISGLQFTCSCLSTRYLLKAQGKLATVGSASFMWHVLHLPIKFFGQRSVGDLSGRLALNRTVAESLVTTLAPIIVQFITALFCLYVMIAYNCWLAGIGVLGCVLKIIFARLLSNKRINYSRVMMRDAANLSNATIAGFKTIETLKATGSINGFFQRWSGYAASMNNQSTCISKLYFNWGMMPDIIGKLFDTFILILGVFFIMSGDFTIGMLSAFQGILLQFSSPVAMLITSMQTIQEMRTSMERIDDVMHYPKDDYLDFNSKSKKEKKDCMKKEDNNIYSKNEVDLTNKLKGNIEIKNLTFGYSELGEPLIKNLNLSVKQGQSVAFVGPSGCGKSTIARLISGLYKPWSGEILFDGTPIEDIPKEKRCASISVVDQNIVLFASSVKDNLTMWDETIPNFTSILSTRDVDMYDTIMERPGSFEYMLSEDGSNFSGGERQRLEIARALTSEPTIMILDEATSALDAKTELKLMQTIKRNGMSTILVTHRLSAIRNCDEILVLDHGKVIERGTHEELMKNDGMYVRLVAQE